MMRKELLRFAQRKCTHAMNETGSKEQRAMLLMLKLLELSISDLEARHGGKFTEGDDEAKQHARMRVPSSEGSQHALGGEKEQGGQGESGPEDVRGGGEGRGGDWQTFQKGMLAAMNENHRVLLEELRGVKYSIGLLERR